MGFHKQLSTGKFGARLELPQDMNIVEEHPQMVVLRDDTRHVVWEIRFANSFFDPSRQHEELLRRDIEDEARIAFERETLHAKQAGELPPDFEPRTADPEWSPVIAVRRHEHDTASLVTVVHRLTYHPGDECIAGRVLLPTTKGTLIVSALKVANPTGLRETALALRKTAQAEQEMQKRDEALDDAELLSLTPPQAEFDDEKHDELFPEHPLTRVRAALKWLLESGEVLIDVAIPPEADRDSPVEAAGTGCVVTPPPRHLYSPGMAALMSPTLAPFNRFGFDPDIQQLFEVWRVPDVTLRGFARGFRLKRLAAATYKSWVDEGAADVKYQMTSLTGKERLELRCFVSLATAVGPSHSAAIWIADKDGVVFRISAGGPLSISREELSDRLEKSLSTWQRLC